MNPIQVCEKCVVVQVSTS